MTFVEAVLSLPHSCPGEDLNSSIVIDKNGLVNVKGTLKNMIKILHQSIDNLEKMCNEIPDANSLDIYSNGHSVGICGDNKVIRNLIEKKLVIEGDFSEGFVNTDSLEYSDFDSDSDLEF
jgi:hypothetical protein